MSIFASEYPKLISWKTQRFTRIHNNYTIITLSRDIVIHLHLLYFAFVDVVVVVLDLCNLCRWVMKVVWVRELCDCVIMGVMLVHDMGNVGGFWVLIFNKWWMLQVECWSCVGGWSRCLFGAWLTVYALCCMVHFMVDLIWPNWWCRW